MSLTYEKVFTPFIFYVGFFLWWSWIELFEIWTLSGRVCWLFDRTEQKHFGPPKKQLFSGLFCRLSDKTELEALRFFRSAIEYTIIFDENVSWIDTPFTSIVDVYVDYSTQLTDELAHELIAELAD